MTYSAAQRVLVMVSVLLAALTFASPALATTPGVNGRIVFSSDATGSSQLYTVDPSGHGLRQITHIAGGASSPDWSPNGRQLTFNATDGQCRIAISHANGSHRHLLPAFAETVCDYQPAFTAAGGRIVFASLIPSELEDLIVVERLDGTHAQILDNGSNRVTDPNVSPDGRSVTIVWFAGSDSPPDSVGQGLIRKGIDGSFQQSLLPLSAFVGVKHDWAPSGRRILFTGNSFAPGESANIATIRADGSGIRWLTHYTDPQRSAFAGSYSPDGHWIVYELQHGDKYALMRMHPDGTHKRVILPLSSFHPEDADWGPRPTR